MTIDKESILFLLGGYDLEMATIREVLLEEGLEEGKHFFDKKLSWGAKLSSYRDILEKYPEKTLYGIELTEDIELPKNYRRIDHHNDYAERDASLLQVLILLGREPTRYEKLVAANDVGHKNAMRCMGATEEETEHIRQKDRIAQGVTRQMELTAKEELERVLKTRTAPESLLVIKSSLDTFTPLVDLCNERPLLIYNNTSLMYYGDISKLKAHYAKEIEQKNAFYGRSYFGFDEDFLKTTAVENYVKEIGTLFNAETFISYHSFMFPFSFDKTTHKHEKTLHERIEIDQVFADALAKHGWQYGALDLQAEKNTHLYNEYTYFTEPVRDTLYNGTPDFKTGETSYYFTKEVTDGEYIISLNSGDTYILKLTDLSLRLFETGIGILVFETENHTHRSFDDILKINEFGRRVYPQFLDDSCDIYTAAAKGVFLADKISVRLHKEMPYITESFTDAYKKQIPKHILIGSHIVKLLGEGLFVTEEKNDTYRIEPILDDRMFVVSYAENRELMECLQKEEENYTSNDDWYRYLFVDAGAKTVQFAPMQKTLTEASTYTRWLGWGTLWGITRYSLVALTTEGGRGLVLPHTQYHYHQMAVIILAIRASLARFSREISGLSNLKNKNEGLEKKVQMLYEHYIKFVNKLYFRELTAQDQGIELYNMAKELIGFDGQIKALDDEIAELHTYVSMINEQNREKELDTISKIGAIFLPPSLLAGILGINSVNFHTGDAALLFSIAMMFLTTLLGVAALNKRRWLKYAALVLMPVVLAVTPCLLKQEPSYNWISQLQRTLHLSSDVVKDVPKEKKEKKE